LVRVDGSGSRTATIAISVISATKVATQISIGKKIQYKTLQILEEKSFNLIKLSGKKFTARMPDFY